MVLMLLPASALPLSSSATSRSTSHYESLRDQSLTAHRTLATFIASQLEADSDRSLQQLKAASGERRLRDRQPVPDPRGASQRPAATATPSCSSYARQPELHVIAVGPADARDRGQGRLRRVGTGRLPAKAGRLPVPGRRRGHAALLRRHRFLRTDGERRLPLAEVSLAPLGAASQRAIIKNQTTSWPPCSRRGRRTTRSASTRRPTLSYGRRCSAALRRLEATEQEIGGEAHHVMFQRSTACRSARRRPADRGDLRRRPRQVMMTYVGIIAALFVALSVLLFILARSITGPMRRIAEAASAFADGRLDVRAQVVGPTSSRRSPRRSTKWATPCRYPTCACGSSTSRSSSCSPATMPTPDEEVGRAGLHPMPGRGRLVRPAPGPAREVDYAEDQVFVGLHGWVWKNHRSMRGRRQGSRAASGGGWTATGCSASTSKTGAGGGVLRVAFRSSPDDTMVSLLHSLSPWSRWPWPSRTSSTKAHSSRPSSRWPRRCSATSCRRPWSRRSRRASPITTSRPAGWAATGSS